MDKRELATIVSNKTGLCRKDCELVISKTFETIREANIRRDKVYIRGFGTFGWKTYEEQDFFQPRDGSTYKLPPRDLPTMNPSDGFVKAMRKSQPQG